MVQRSLASIAAVALLAVGAAGRAIASEWTVLPADRVFPPGGPASADTLDAPLSRRIAAWRARTGRRSFQKRIVVHKARRRLDVFADGDVLKSYVVELGLA